MAAFVGDVTGKAEHASDEKRMSYRTKNKPVVFVAHSGCEEYLHALNRYLPEYEITVSDWGDKSGTNLAQKITSDITRADLVAVLLTVAACTSAWVNQEIGFALGLGKKVLPILEGGESTKLPGLLGAAEWEVYEPTSLEASAMRAALRISKWLQEDLTRVFNRYHDYSEWWITVDERSFTDERCYWATPHDTWSWIMAHLNIACDLEYRTLIRGDYEFDQSTLHTHYDPGEAVCGVAALSAFEEIAVFGALSVEVAWEPSFCAETDKFLREMPSVEALFRWYQDVSRRSTCIEVRMALDERRAARHRQRLDSLFDQHRKGRV
jgi:hypothetical protein